MHQIFLATHNLSKIKRLQNYLKIDNLQLLSFQDYPSLLSLPEEDGNSELENAKIKAKSYYQQVQITCLALDNGLYFEQLPADQQPGKHVQRIAGVLDTDSPQVRFDKMVEFYSQLARQHGGFLPGYFLDVYCLFDGKEFYYQQARRNIVLTDQVHQVDLDFPICSLYQVNGVYYHDLSTEQMQAFLEPSLQAVRKLILDYLENHNRHSEQTNVDQTESTAGFFGPVSAVRIGLKPLNYGDFFLDRMRKEITKVQTFQDLQPLLLEISQVLDAEKDKESLRLIFQQVGRRNPQWAAQFKQIFKSTPKLSKAEIQSKYAQVRPQFMINPSYEEQKTSELDLVVSGTADNIVMVEAGANIVTEEILGQALDLAMHELKILNQFQQEFLAKCHAYDQQLAADNTQTETKTS